MFAARAPAPEHDGYESLGHRSRGRLSQAALLGCTRARVGGMARRQGSDASLATAAKWALWTQDSRLRGANIYQRRIYDHLDSRDTMGESAAGPPHVEADFEALAELGAEIQVKEEKRKLDLLAS